MSADAMIRSLKALKLHGMAQSISDLANQSSPAFNQSVSLINTLIKAEVAEREVRSINYQMKVARFPAYRDLAGFDFDQSSVSVALIKTLHQCDFLDESQNVVFVLRQQHILFYLLFLQQLYILMPLNLMYHM